MISFLLAFAGLQHSHETNHEITQHKHSSNPQTQDYDEDEDISIEEQRFLSFNLTLPLYMGDNNSTEREEKRLQHLYQIIHHLFKRPSSHHKSTHLEFRLNTYKETSNGNEEALGDWIPLGEDNKSSDNETSGDPERVVGERRARCVIEVSLKKEEVLLFIPDLLACH